MGHLDDATEPLTTAANVLNSNNNNNQNSNNFETILSKSSGQLTVILLVCFALLGFFIIVVYVGFSQGLIKSCYTTIKRRCTSKSTNNKNNNNKSRNSSIQTQKSNKISVRSRKKSQIISVSEHLPEFQTAQGNFDSSLPVKVVIENQNTNIIEADNDHDSILGDATICDDHYKELPPDPDLLNRNSLFALKADYYAHQTRYHKDVSQIPRHLIRTTIKNRELVSENQQNGILKVQVQGQNQQQFKDVNSIKTKSPSANATDESTNTDTENTIHQPDSQILNKPLFKLSAKHQVQNQNSTNEKGSSIKNSSSSISSPLKKAVLTFFNNDKSQQCNSLQSKVNTHSHRKISKSNSRDKNDDNSQNLAQKFEVSNPYNIPQLDQINRVNNSSNQNPGVPGPPGYFSGKNLPGYKPNDVIGRASRHSNNFLKKSRQSNNSSSNGFMSIPKFVPGNTSCTLLSY